MLARYMWYVSVCPSVCDMLVLYQNGKHWMLQRTAHNSPGIVFGCKSTIEMANLNVSLRHCHQSGRKILISVFKLRSDWMQCVALLCCVATVRQCAVTPGTSICNAMHMAMHPVWMHQRMVPPSVTQCCLAPHIAAWSVKEPSYSKICTSLLKENINSCRFGLN